MTTQPESMKNSFWWGLAFLLMGAAATLAAAGVIPTEEESFHAPRWVAASAGLVFVWAGALVCLADERFSIFKERWWFGAIGTASAAGLFICFALPFNWVAFGPGEREFSGGISIPFLSIEFANANELLGRAVFGLAALFMDAIIVFGTGSVVWEWLKGEWRLLNEEVEELFSEEDAS